jgi:hypothetical protein
MSVDDNESSIGFLGRQEILTGLIIAVLALIPIGAIITMIIVFSQPNIIDSISITGSVDIGKFVDKMVESYDAFLLMLGVGIGSGGTITAIKLGSKFCGNGKTLAE